MKNKIINVSYLKNVLKGTVIPEKNSVYDKCLFGQYEDAPVMRARIEFILMNFKMSKGLRDQLEDIRDN